MALPKPKAATTIQDVVNQNYKSMKVVEQEIRTTQSMLSKQTKNNSAAFNVIMNNIADQLQEASRSSINERSDQINTFDYIRNAIDQSVFTNEQEREVAIAAYNSAITSMKNSTTMFDKLGNTFVKRVGDVTGILSTVFNDMPPIFGYLSTRIGDFASSFMEDRKTKRERSERLQNEISESIFAALKESNTDVSDEREEQAIIRETQEDQKNKIVRDRNEQGMPNLIPESLGFFGKFTKGFMSVFSKGVLVLMKGMLLAPLGIMILSGLAYVYKKFENQIIEMKDFVIESIDNIKLRAIEIFENLKNSAEEGYNYFIDKTIEGFAYLERLADQYIVEPIRSGLSTLEGLANQYIIDPIVNGYTYIEGLFKQYVIDPIQYGYETISSLTFEKLLNPITSAFTTIGDSIKTQFIDPVATLFESLFEKIYDLMPDWAKESLKIVGIVPEQQKPKEIIPETAYTKKTHDVFGFPIEEKKIQEDSTRKNNIEQMDTNKTKELETILKPYTYKDMVKNLDNNKPGETKLTKVSNSNVNIQPIVNNTINSTTHQNRVINMTDPYGGLAAGALR